MPYSICRSSALLWLAISGVAHAQLPSQQTMPAMDPALCDQLATIPNSPMTVAACKSMLKIVRDDPSAARPGDDALSCPQIDAEIQSTPGLGVSDAEAARTQALIRDSQTLDARMGAETAAAIAPETATLTALASVGGVLPNAVAASAAAGPTASILAKTSKTAQANLAERRRMSDETAAILDARMGNPRVSHLSKLAMAKGCATANGIPVSK